MRKNNALWAIAFASGVSAVWFGLSPGNVADAATDCLAAPNAPTPQGKHWYYRYDRVNKRRCWYLGPQGRKTRPDPAQVEPTERASAAPSKPSPRSVKPEPRPENEAAEPAPVPAPVAAPVPAPVMQAPAPVMQPRIDTAMPPSRAEPSADVTAARNALADRFKFPPPPDLRGANDSEATSASDPPPQTYGSRATSRDDTSPASTVSTVPAAAPAPAVPTAANVAAHEHATAAAFRPEYALALLVGALGVAGFVARSMSRRAAARRSNRRQALYQRPAAGHALPRELIPRALGSDFEAAPRVDAAHTWPLMPAPGPREPAHHHQAQVEGRYADIEDALRQLSHVAGAKRHDRRPRPAWPHNRLRLKA